jgi:hypothetical protein
LGKSVLIAIDTIQNRILFIRGQRVMMDYDLAHLYEVDAKVLNQAVKRNLDRFPEDFMFQLTAEGSARLRSQTVTLTDNNENKGVSRYRG